jgi:hypothetical protein
MPRARSYDSLSDIKRHLKAGRGTGEGDDFLSWFETQDVPSQGRRHRHRSLTHDIVHHLMSDVEEGALFAADASGVVRQVRTQVAMPLQDTIKICDALRYKHPTHPKTGCLWLMTLDQTWDVELADGQIVRCGINAKLSTDRKKKRNQEKLEIEKAYCAKHGMPLIEIDELSVSDNFVRNWSFIRSLAAYPNQERSGLAKLIDLRFREWVAAHSPTQDEIVQKVVADLAVPRRDVLPALHTLLATLVWCVDLHDSRLGPSFTYRLT